MKIALRQLHQDERFRLRHLLADKLTRARRKTSLGQLDVADRLGLSRNTISLWENGNREPDVSQLVRLAALYGVQAASLLPVPTNCERVGGDCEP